MPKLPEQLLNSLAFDPNFDREAFIAAHEDGERTISVRLNPFKPAHLQLGQMLPVPWAASGFYLAERPVFTLDPLFHAGCYYVQEPGSMFLEHMIRAGVGDISNWKVLDLCAAPGGKSTLINSLLGEEGMLVANEITKNRVPALVYNLAKWGTANVIVSNNDPRQFARLPNEFDLLVVDAPCSGSGLFRKQPEAILQWSESAVLMCSRRQRELLADALPSLKSGGFLIYSTCSYSREENEEIVDWLCTTQGLEFVRLPVEPGWGIVENDLGYRFYPDQSLSEGFFCALLRKTGIRSHEKERKPPKRSLNSPVAQPTLRHFLRHEKGTILRLHERWHFGTRNCMQFALENGGFLYMKKAGQFIGIMKGNDLVPSHELALSNYLSEEVERANVDHQSALAFLRKSGFSAEMPGRGLRLITYQSYGIGWAKFIEGRVNNYLPGELRILI